MTQSKNVPDAARFLLEPERMQRFVELYKRAKSSGDDRVIAAANDALKHFRDAEAALASMMAAEATVNQYLSK